MALEGLALAVGAAALLALLVARTRQPHRRRAGQHADGSEGGDGTGFDAAGDDGAGCDAGSDGGCGDGGGGGD
jgi:hypothetical protein